MCFQIPMLYLPINVFIIVFFNVRHKRVFIYMCATITSNHVHNKWFLQAVNYHDLFVSFFFHNDQKSDQPITTWTRLESHFFKAIRPKKKVSSFWSPRESPQTRASAFLIFFFFAVKRCPIAARIAGSIGILPCCAFNDLFT